MGIVKRAVLLALLLVALAIAGEYAPKFMPEIKTGELYKQLTKSAARYAKRIHPKPKIKEAKPSPSPFPKNVPQKNSQEKEVVSRRVSDEVTAGAIFEWRREPVGTTFLFKRSGVFGAVSVANIYGPPGWNKGNMFRCKLYTLPGMSRDRALCWGIIPAMTGTYTIKSWVRGQMQVEHVFINTEMRINVPQIMRIRSDPGGAVRVRWEASTDVRSFLLRVNPFPYTAGNITREIVLSGGTRSMSFTGLPLVRGKQYQVSLFAFSKNLRIPVSTRGPFNVGHQSLLFRAR